jgi:hypothetical protein
MIRITLLLLSIFLLAGCNPCSLEDYSGALSPDRRWEAITCIADCGATTAEISRVDIRQESRPFGHKRITAFAVKHQHSISVSWADHLVTVYCSDCRPEEILVQKDHVEEVAIAYRLGETDPPHLW